MRSGFAVLTCWFEFATSQLSAEDDRCASLNPPGDLSLDVANASVLLQRSRQSANFPPDNAQIYFGAAKHDYVCFPKTCYVSFTQEVFSRHFLTIKECDADHWLVLSHADEIARDLEEWIRHRYHESWLV
ncbi:uncharacterized protein PHACADRAFT_253530, partial [Phanerochaete carnosa HHB-10118-sp]